MTVREMFETKYKERMATINRRGWENAKFFADRKHWPVHKVVLLAVEITEADLKKWGVSYYGSELEDLHKAKGVASNRHKQEHGHLDRYWLTEKGYRLLGF